MRYKTYGEQFEDMKRRGRCCGNCDYCDCKDGLLVCDLGIDREIVKYEDIRPCWKRDDD